MHSRRQLVEARLTTVRRDLDEILDKLSQDQMDDAPAEGMRTTAGQLLEIAMTEWQLIERLRDDRWTDDDDIRAAIGDWQNLERLKQVLQATRGTTLNYLESLSEGDLAQEVEFECGWLGSLGLETLPRSEVFVNIASHEWYHVGQLTSYLGAMGVSPYDA